jgi:hypothetical protein
VTVVACVAWLACAGEDPAGPGAGGNGPGGNGPGGRALLPASLRLEAAAVSVDAQGRRVDCGVTTLVMLGTRTDRRGDRVVQFGAGGGEARRYRDLSTDRAVQFWADTYFPTLEFHLIGSDSVEVRSPESEGTPERFWREFALWAGHTRAANRAAGELATGVWTCWPMDTPPSSGEYYDAEGVAVGTWRLVVGS